MSKLTIIKELLFFLKFRKRYWLIPIVCVLVVLGILIFFAQSSALAPFIYALF